MACVLSDLFCFEIVSLDSVMVYRGLDIGSAKPKGGHHHHLIDVCDPDVVFSVMDYFLRARSLIFEINARGNHALIVGGTMMYANALLNGLSLLPPVDPKIRNDLKEELKERGLDSLRSELLKIDSSIKFLDSQRVLRELELYRQTGLNLSRFRARSPLISFDHVLDVVTLVPTDRSGLRVRIVDRLDGMLRDGLIDEIISLKETYSNLNSESNSMRSVGYRQFWSYLDGRIGFKEARDLSIFATLNLAKRQCTWMRRFSSDLCLDFRKGVLSEIIRFCDRFNYWRRSV